MKSKMLLHKRHFVTLRIKYELILVIAKESDCALTILCADRLMDVELSHDH